MTMLNHGPAGHVASESAGVRNSPGGEERAMSAVRPFRFGAAAYRTDEGAAYTENARRVEALGYDTLGVGDHFSPNWFAAGPALTAIALATTTVRVSCTVYANDFRHPALLAKEAASIDVLSGGRLEFGLGAGWHKREYDQLGLPFDPPGVRVARLEEALGVIKGLWGDGPVTHAGRHYTIDRLEGMPKPAQRPRPPVFIGGGGKRLLGVAAREADIVGLIAQATAGGNLDVAGDSEAVLAQKVGWVREAAGERFGRLELAMLIWQVAVTDDRRAAAEEIAAARGLTPAQVLTSPYFLLGSVEHIVERVQALREQYGISYFTVFPGDVEAFAPVVARLAGT
jgi:probable F420-dependent oxidoreductase